MPVLDGNFEAFVTNLGKYNEGALVGDWVFFFLFFVVLLLVFVCFVIGS